MISVGATSLSLKNSSQLKYKNNAIEVVWNEDFGISGGGYSQFFHAEEYQQTALLNTINGPQSYRGEPDITASGGVIHGYTIYISLPDLDGQGIEPPGFISVGGTSASTQMWSALWTMITDGEFVHAGKFLYSSEAAAGFHDITVGNNIVTTPGFGANGYSATRGYDLCSGIGSPDGEKLRAAVKKYLYDN